MEKFLLEHGEQVVDILGAEVDRIELRIKVCVDSDLLNPHIMAFVLQKESPEVRHVDLEIL